MFVFNQQKRINLAILLFVVIVIACFFQFMVIKNILLDVYGWHLSQPESIQGGIELLILMLVFTLVIWFFKPQLSLFLVFLLSLFYLKFNQVLVSTIVSYTYIECIIVFGGCILSIFRISRGKNISNYLAYFTVGLSFWSMFAIILSLLGKGTFDDLRILTAILSIFSLLYFVKKKKTPFLIWKIIQSVQRFNRGEQILTSFLLSLVLVEFAKSNRAIDYDSIWYGLRPEYVLIGPNSFFDNLGLVQFVHYYPKLMELFFIPISGLGDYSFIYAANTVIFLLLIILVFSLAKLMGTSDLEALFLSCLISSTPTIANMASTAKTDLFTSFFLLLSVYYFLLLLRKPIYYKYFFMIICPLILSLGGKITSFLYAPLLVLGIILMILYHLGRDKEKTLKLFGVIKNRVLKFMKFEMVILFSSLFVLGGIFYRTYSLTGYPLFPLLSDVWHNLGFELKYPFTQIPQLPGLSDEKFTYISRWYNLLFDPKDFPHIINTWTGNLIFYMFIVFICLLIFRQVKVRNLILTEFIIFLPWLVSGVVSASIFNKGGDGNYYIIPLIATAMIFYVGFTRLKRNFVKIMIYLSLALFIPTQTMITFVSHWSWQWGTDVVNYSLVEKELDTEIRNKKIFQESGLTEIETYIISKTNKARAVGFGTNNVSEQVLNRLSCRFENINGGLGSAWYGNPEIVSSEDEFLRYLEWAEIDYVIIPKEKIEGYEPVFTVYNQLKEMGGEEIESRDFYLLDISFVKK
ncbi:hypothetical protein R6U77_01930 [Lysinibacillus louembei]|uniref:Glycosyltransferase RgtA/B/C/D-like domain-containing protein n=1 Tax=Lysinibacillus louembei TaxID=1470088 RepID=A0ABZ0RW63_9BACI|nr:hypothetical protein [Lysinibacillus louembei]WPK12478.1 hypothetical protein R6U77_01930 [Lysinibacillus louembei]